MEQFHILLRETRRSVGITQRDLARRAHVSRSSLLAYELRRRHPTRETLSRVIDSLGVDLQRRNELLAAAGYAVEANGTRFHANPLTLEEARASVEARPWVSFLLNELIEVRAASQAALALWSITEEMLEHPAERNMLAILMQPWYADGIDNWEDAARFHIAIFKARVGLSSGEPTGAYVNAVLEDVERGRPKLVTRFFELWDTTPAMAREFSSSWYPIRWNHDGQRLTFHVLNNIVNEQDALYTSDWLPADETTCHCVAGLLQPAARRKRAGQRRRVR